MVRIHATPIALGRFLQRKQATPERASPGNVDQRATQNDRRFIQRPASMCASPSVVLFALLAFVLPLVHGSRAAENSVEVAGTGPDVLLLPDLASSGAALKPIADDLRRCFRTHTFTLAGFAGQPANPSPQVPAWERSLSDYIGKLDAAQAIVIGHGLGGILGLRLAIDHPQRVRQLVVLDALPFPAAVGAPGATRPHAQEIQAPILTQSAEDFRTMQQQTLSSLTTHPESVPMLVEWAIHSDRHAMADALDEMLTTDLRKRVADVRTPTLVLVPWEPSQPQDAATTLDLYRKQYAGLTQAQVKIIKGSRHFLTFDQPIVTNWAIEEFLGGCAH